MNFRISLRHLWKNKLFSIINVLGLSLGLVCCTLILLHVKFELSYDRFHVKKDRISRVLTDNFALTPYVLAPALYEYCPEIEKISRITKFDEGRFFVKQNETATGEKGLMFADSCFFDVFSFPVTHGDPEKMLRASDRILISERMAEKYFKVQNAEGNQITLRIDNKDHEFIVEGIFKDFPEQSHFHANILLSMEFFAKQRNESSLTNWGNSSILTYILTKQPDMNSRINEKLPGLITKYVPEDKAKDLHFRLQPLCDIHLYSNSLLIDIEPQGSITRVIIFASIAVLVLVIALVNFILLSMALSFQRIREFGIRKVNGALGKQLVSLVTAEFLIVFLMALIIGVIILVLIIPFFEINMSLKILHGFMINLGTVSIFLALVIVLGYLASVYIALQVARFRPIEAIKNTIPVNDLKIPSRGVLVIFQFSIMICLVSCLIGIQKQLSLLHNKDLGFRKEQLVVFEIPYDSYPEYTRLKEELRTIPAVIAVSGAAYIPPNNEFWIFDLKDPASGESFQFEEINADYDFIETMGIEMLQGRSFSNDYGRDSSAVIINETALRNLGIKDVLDYRLQGPEYYPWRSEMTVIGVFRDFHIRSLYEKIYPMAIFLSPHMVSKMAVKIAPESLEQNMKLIETKWSSVFPEDPMQFSYVNEAMRLKYIKEDQTNAMISLFTFLSLIIALLGLFGLSIFVIERRTKEIGLRKVYGSSNLAIVYLLSRQFSLWVGVSFLLAVPVAWYALNRWLQHFAYKTELSWWIFALSGLASICIAIFTISFQTYKAASGNPIEALKYE